MIYFGGGGGGVERDQISDIRPQKIKYQISRDRKKSDIWFKNQHNMAKLPGLN